MTKKHTREMLESTYNNCSSLLIFNKSRHEENKIVFAKITPSTDNVSFFDEYLEINTWGTERKICLLYENIDFIEPI